MALPYISELRLFAAILVAALLITAWLGAAAFAHDRNRRAVPLRVHVAGSRGKTTTARLIGAALRASGRRVLVKTTGTDPVLVLPDGSERPWPRWGPASISEQVRFFRQARRHKADAVVLESMAIEPEYLWASEEYLVRATHTVITNARPDHAEVVGSHPLAAAHAMSLVVPRGTSLLLSAEAAVSPILARAERRKCKVTVVPSFAHHVDANRALALAVCTSVGMEPDAAITAFGEAGSDPGAFFLARGTTAEGRPFRFANAFSCNDTQSLDQLWKEHSADGASVFLLNVRNDRPERTRAFLSYLAGLDPDPVVYVTGFVPQRWVRDAGFDKGRVRRLRANDPRKAIAMLSAAAGEGATIWGVGNYAHLGRAIVRLVKAEAVPC